eukprot:2527067-Amphidinium_carterae.1
MAPNLKGAARERERPDSRKQRKKEKHRRKDRKRVHVDEESDDQERLLRRNVVRDVAPHAGVAHRDVVVKK